jgi:DNA excision repair protein ERCC-4
MYQQGGVFCITSRILIVDLLTGVANSIHIDGFLVAHAESVTEDSTEAFILRIFQTQKQFASPLTTTTTTTTYQKGFIKALSESPEAIVSGFAKLNKVMKALHLRRLYLYPRFQATIADELERQPPHVDELHQQLTPLMKDIQHAIAAAVQTCIRELKSSTTLIEWNDQDLTVENCVTKNFDQAISRQLEGDWHRLKPQTKQLVQDLRTLRTLFVYLIHYDCISFWKLINSIKTISAAARHPSMWLFTPAADMLFRKAKERLYTIHTPKPTKQIPNPVSQLKSMLEENPKWRLVLNILNEIRDEDCKQNPVTTEGSIKNVLIMVKDERTVNDLRGYLSDGKHKTMMKRWLRYLEGFNDRFRSVSKSANGSATISEESRLLLEEEQRTRHYLYGRNGTRTTNSTTNKAYTSESSRKTNAVIALNHIPDYMRKYRKVIAEKSRGRQTQQQDDLERQAALNEALEVTEQELGRHTTTKTTSTSTTATEDVCRLLLEEKQNSTRKHHSRISGTNNTTTLVGGTKRKKGSDALPPAKLQTTTKSRRKNNKGEEPVKSKIQMKMTVVEGTSSDMENRTNHDSKPSSVDFVPIDIEYLDKDDDSEEDYDGTKWYEASDYNELRISVRSYSSVYDDQGITLLRDLQPPYVILYDADISFVRGIEIYSSLQPKEEPRIRVYFILFEASAEEKIFRKSLERENSSFEKLIHQKKTMSPSIYTLTGTSSMTQEVQQAIQQQQCGGSGGPIGVYAGGTLAYDTRTGRGKAKTSTEKRDIAVDVREFRSVLPSILHQGGMRLAPVTLTVGDFVLSNVHCVERKSISDLFGSFASGRLYTQAESMSKYYKCPCLLIEFDPNKSFCLQNQNELGVEIRTDSVCSKMVLLTSHFPQLRILWSRSPHETLRIFKELKQTHEEVDVEKALEVGKNESLDDVFRNNHDNIQEDSTDPNKRDDAGSVGVHEINEVARDMLLRLPGITVPSARKIMQEITCLADLVLLSREELKRLAGPVTGQKLFTFFRQKFGAT